MENKLIEASEETKGLVVERRCPETKVLRNKLDSGDVNSGAWAGSVLVSIKEFRLGTKVQ